MVPFLEARRRLTAEAAPVNEVEEVALTAALGRVLAEEVVSPIAVPAMPTAEMDGYAVRAVDVPSAGVRLPVSGEVSAGGGSRPLVPRTAMRIFTGAPLPEGADSVVMQEVCRREGEWVVFEKAAEKGAAVRAPGSEVAAGSVVLPAGYRLDAAAVALAASVGRARVQVYRRVRVALFSTGDELVMPGRPLPAGGVYNSNLWMVQGLLQGLGCEVVRAEPVEDSLPAMERALLEASEIADLVLTTGGVSVGSRDFVRPALERVGKVTFWRVAMRPGRPLAVGRVRDRVAVGLPGNPVSSFVTFVLLVRPLVLRLMGATQIFPAGVWGEAAFEWQKPDPRRSFLRGRLGEEGRVELFPNQGSAAIASLVWANGLVEIAEEERVNRGDRVRFWPFAALLT
ncbi:MAG: molybdopterin molybdotransferase MoeA [Hydrogenophilus sp.]|nr:molybdopterin molybdotransferase MoeA [Hydrogenophilus sp.]